MSKRQDWCAEVSWNFFNLITPIITFTVSRCALDANILRDAVLVRLENIRFEAYVHVNALNVCACARARRGLAFFSNFQLFLECIKKEQIFAE
jgi:hypothetical protein